jgi:hypothetical protein
MYRIKYLRFGPMSPRFCKVVCRIGKHGCYCWRLVGRIYIVKIEWRLL